MWGVQRAEMLFLSNQNCFVWFLTYLILHFLPQSSEGFLKTGVRPQGFSNECLLCKVEVGNKEYKDVLISGSMKRITARTMVDLDRYSSWEF